MKHLTSVNIFEIDKHFPNVDFNPIVVVEDILKKTDILRPSESKHRQIDVINQTADSDTEIKVELSALDDYEQVDKPESMEKYKIENDCQLNTSNMNVEDDDSISCVVTDNTDASTEESVSENISAMSNGFECFVCQKMFKFQSTLQFHLKAKHKENEQPKQFTCNLCSKTFSSQSILQNHISTNHHSLGRFMCTVCGKICRSKFTLRIHGYIHTGQTPYKCKYEGCEMYFRNPTSRNKHLQKHNAKRYHCSVDRCTNRYENVSDLRQHKEDVHNIYIFNYKCQNCWALFNRKQSLIDHIQTKHSDMASKMELRHLLVQQKRRYVAFKCKQCDKYFESKQLFSNHLRIHSAAQIRQKQDKNKQKEHQEQIQKQQTQATTFDCNHINTQQVLPNDDESTTHNSITNVDQNHEFIKLEELSIESPPDFDLLDDSNDQQLVDGYMASNRNESEKFTCKNCKKIFSHWHNLIQHISTVHDPNKKKYECDICGTSFSSGFQLQKHIDAAHLHIEKFKCNTCQMTFKRKTTLREHERIHSGEKPFICEHNGCDKSFRTRRLKLQHERYHSDARPYVCGIDGCERAFKCLQNVRMHRGRIHGIFNINYSCEICAEIFNDDIKLMQHIHEKHQIIG